MNFNFFNLNFFSCNLNLFILFGFLMYLEYKQIALIPVKHAYPNINYPNKLSIALVPQAFKPTTSLQHDKNQKKNLVLFIWISFPTLAKTFLKVIEFATKNSQHYKILHKNKWLTHNSWEMKNKMKELMYYWNSKLKCRVRRWLLCECGCHSRWEPSTWPKSGEQLHLSSFT